MAKHWETFEHPSDIGLAGRADSLGELFEAMAEGLSEAICYRRQVRQAGKRTVSVQAEDVESLLVDFLSAVQWAIQTDHFLVASVRVGKADPSAVEADLLGEPYDPARHELKVEVKAVTYHQLKVAQEAGRWIARVIVDI